MTAGVPVVPDGQQQLYDAWHIAPAMRAGDLILCSGVLGRSADGSIPDDLDAQFEAAFAAISNVLAAAGASLNDIVELVTYHTHLESDLEVFHAVKDRHIGAPYPAWTAVEVTALGAGTAPGARVEIKATAYHRLPH